MNAPLDPLAGLLHLTVPQEFTAEDAPKDGIGHYVVNSEGDLNPLAEECPECGPRLAAWLRGEAVDGWPPMGLPF